MKLLMCLIVFIFLNGCIVNKNSNEINSEDQIKSKELIGQQLKYDDASWHYEGDYPDDLSEQSAYTHIGVFMAWSIKNGLASEFHLIETSNGIEDVKNNVITGGQFLAKYCDGKLTNEELNETGSKFAQEFYENEYLKIYSELVDPNNTFESLYYVEDNFKTYNKVAPTLTKKFQEWLELNESSRE